MSEQKTDEQNDDKKQVDAEYAARLRREKAASDAKASELQKKYDELFAEQEKATAAKLAEEKRFQELADTEKKRADRIEREAAEKLTASERRYVLAEAKAAAIKAGIIDVDDVRSLKLDDLKINSDGEVDGLDDLITAAKEKKPHWFTKPDDSTESKSDSNQRAFDNVAPKRVADNKNVTTKDAFQMSDAEFKAAMDAARMVR